MFSPIRTLFMYFPLRAWSTVLVLLAISWYAYKHIYRKYEMNRLTWIQGGSCWLLVSYILFLLFFTVLGRRSLDYYRYNFDIGYSFRDVIYNGTPNTITLIMVNIVIFVPVGFLGTLSAKRFGVFKALFIGIMLTSAIELSQLLLRNGTCEIDDLIINTIGTISGGFLAVLFRPVIRRIKLPPIQFPAYFRSSKPPKPSPDDPRWVEYEIELIERT